MIKNAVIIGTQIGGIDGKFSQLTAWLTLQYESGVQGFGGYVLYPDLEGKNYAGHFIQRCLEIADVDSWDKITGKTIRVDVDEKLNSAIDGVGHIIKDDWFYPAKDFAV